MIPPRHFALIPAAGVGARMGADHPKQYLPLAGKAMLLHALETFALHPLVEHSFVVVSAEDGYIDDVLGAQTHLQDKVTVLRHGGQTRHASVLNGLRVIGNQLTDSDWVLVHDAARPGLTGELIDRLVHTLEDDAIGGLLALPIVDTLKRSDAQSRVQETVSRENLWAAQTPQMFRYGLLKHALESATHVTDEASAIEALGHHPKLVEGSPRNFKVTLPHDVALAELHLKGNS
ncbi:2-C-methyl-D-erythritol 4-phosphate cytidylyltransferase [Noviherbaspirillum sp. Root189]|uniref:2-C-methyl-D-erythritol 4-phosphate cytidylyltransferase n=1 Tax=Noviherbaspirillum sp. Root189 TaxID=1736487 RepID=UPI00070CA586|nr:2-C-methyl-D-erythritol 4-phosphate cytidylyltransferase [Noviherbaspirillum sp. Root189]KRB70469.1 2-C-methyl-D-erythritol 4-phosphate cytidylyltransferase [Noviherbaspirillum sp. Root189]